MPPLRIALAQINPVMGDFKTNADKIRESIERARGLGADLICFPELALCGYPPEDLLLKPRFLQDNLTALKSLEKHAQGITVILGFAHLENAKAYNAAAILEQGSLAGVYHKAELPNYGVFDEKRYFQPGQDPMFLELQGRVLAVTICEDVWVPENRTQKYVRQAQADIVVNISASPFQAGKLVQRETILADFAKRTQACIIYTNLVGGQDELVFDGGSMLVSAAGVVQASAQRFREELILLEVDPPVRERRKTQNRSGNWISLSASARGTRAPSPWARQTDLGRIEEIFSALVLGTRDYVKKNSFSDVVIGLSGGIDSALTAAIAVEALGSDHVIGVTMPSTYTSSETLADAEALAGNLKIRLMTEPIKSIFTAYAESLAEILGEDQKGIEFENLQARIRGNILMTFSNRFGWLVLTTGNKSEMATGYCTLYGDMAGGFAVIKDVPKTLVYELSDYVNRRAAFPLIPESTIRRPPTAELRPNQKDQDTLPPYAVLDPILQAYVEEDKSPDEIEAMGFDFKVVRYVARLVDLSEYKRRQAPPGVKITPKAFGRDRRLPITNHYRIHQPSPQ